MVSNVSILKGKDKEFIAMPSYKTRQTGKDGKPQYQDVCFPVTKEFREKLYDTILESYKKEREQTADKGMMQAVEQAQARGEIKRQEMSMTFH